MLNACMISVMLSFSLELSPEDSFPLKKILCSRLYKVIHIFYFHELKE